MVDRIIIDAALMRYLVASFTDYVDATVFGDLRFVMKPCFSTDWIFSKKVAYVMMIFVSQ